ncbi:MAG: hypothetical protein K6G32_13235 [Prevotella sp.]|nr:hypothetical protein [Prevotella sp.]
MKKNFIYALMGAIALIGATGFTSCSEEDLAEVNPGYNPETGEVPVDFVFNVETGAKSTTRMAASTVQIGQNTFRGIRNAQLYTYKLTSDGSHVSAGTETANKVYDLNELIAQGQLNGEGTDKSRRVLEMSLPTGTNTLMLWGRAMQGSVGTDKTAAAVYGSIDFAPSSTLTDASFTLKPCVPDDTGTGATILDDGQTALGQYESLIAEVLNDIINASSAVNKTRDGKTVNKTIAWKDYVDFNLNGTITAKEKDPSTYVSADDCANMCALGTILANTFVSLNTFKSSELRNGQGKVIAALVGDIYNLMNSITTTATPTTVEEDAAQVVASGVQSVITKFFKNEGTWQWIETNTVKQNKGISSGFDKVTGDLNKFPDRLFHLPPGATVMTYTAFDNSGSTPVVKNEYAYMSQVPTYAMGSAGGSFNPKNYMYPAELCYFGNSPIRVTSDPHVKAEYPDGASNWDNDNNWKTTYNAGNNTVDWTKNGHVLSSTRSVAMQENINYGTSMLKTTIAYATGVRDLKDNNSGIHTGEADNTIAVSGSPFALTGVLVGGQPQTVGWNYITKTPGAGEPDPYSCMVYDNDLPSTAIPTPSGSENYTMVWDNYKAGDTQNVVYVALELTNNSGKDFWGMNNLIRNGSAFYLIGKLDPNVTSDTQLTSLGKTAEEYAANKSLGITWPTKYALPPYDTDGSTLQVRRVFIQDFVTTASFVIGENSLKTALVSVPDLRASHLSLGLSVDLSWSNGLNFENVVLGQ